MSSKSRILRRQMFLATTRAGNRISICCPPNQLLELCSTVIARVFINRHAFNLQDRRPSFYKLATTPLLSLIAFAGYENVSNSGFPGYFFSSTKVTVPEIVSASTVKVEYP